MGTTRTFVYRYPSPPKTVIKLVKAKIVLGISIVTVIFKSNFMAIASSKIWAPKL